MRAFLIVFLLGIGLVVFFLYFSPSTTSHSLASTSVGANQPSSSASTPLFTSPESTVKQFYSDIIANRFNDVYAMLSPAAHQSLEPVGGAAYLEQQAQTFAQKYGVMTSYTFVIQMNQSPTEVTITLLVHRTKLSNTQTEKDTLTTIFNGESWMIDHWGSDIATKQS